MTQLGRVPDCEVRERVREHMLSYEIIGEGEPLVLVHGISHRRQAWDAVVDRLAEERQVILVDLPGHGESPDLDLGGRTVQEAFKQELIDLFEHLDIDRPHIAGNSLGGRIALEAAADGLVCSATTLSPAGFWHGRWDFLYTRALFAVTLTLSRFIGPVLPWLARTTLGRAALVGWLVARPSQMPVEQLIGDAAGMKRALPGLDPIFAEATPFDRTIPADVAVTIAWAARDVVLPPRHAKRARLHLPGATHLMLPGCGHVPMTDDPELVAQVLLEGSSTVSVADRAA